MARATWLAAVLRNVGLHVIEVDGWHTRETRPGFEPVGVVWHHTATAKNVPDENVRRLLRDGRSDLSGPLAQLGLERDGTFAVIAAGRCNHNGYGEWGNDSIGIEAYNDGVGEPWPKPQLDAYDRGTAAICRALGVGAGQVKAHRETDPGRKIDPTGIDMDAARGRVARLLSTQPQPDTPPIEEDESMFIMKAPPGEVYATRFVDPPVAVTITSGDEKALKAAGVKVLTLAKTTATKVLQQIGQALD